MTQANNAQNEAHRIVARQQRVAALYLEGRTQTAIARHLGVTQKTISLDLSDIRKGWKESALRDFDTMQGEELAKLDRLEAVCWAAWRDSCLKNGARRMGNPRYLEEIRQIITLRLKVIGALKPDSHNTTVVLDWSALASSIPTDPQVDLIEAEIANQALGNVSQSENALALPAPTHTSYRPPCTNGESHDRS